jgi:hypothetical protein
MLLLPGDHLLLPALKEEVLGFQFVQTAPNGKNESACKCEASPYLGII